MSVDSCSGVGCARVNNVCCNTRPGVGSITTVYGGDIHKVGNPAGSGQRLMTIHFYLPPIPEMLVWDEGNPTPRVARSVTLDAEP